MTADNTTPLKKKPGPKPTGLSLPEVRRRATANRVTRLLAEGKVRLDTFVESKTLEQLDILKTDFNVKTQGEVINILVARYLEQNIK